MPQVSGCREGPRELGGRWARGVHPTSTLDSYSAGLLRRVLPALGHLPVSMMTAQQVLPRFGTTPLIKITNAAVRAWVAEMLDAGLSAATVRKAVFALRRCLGRCGGRSADHV
jgi:hypothetical protein